MAKENELTPMMKQYYDAKEASKGALLLFRMGDFYEMFNDDAYKAAKTLNITVTTRDRNKADAMPMAGFPWQHLDSYLTRLVAAGHRVAVCDQMEDPKKAKGVVKREITRIVSPGTMMDESMLDPRQSNYLASIYVADEKRSQKAQRDRRLKTRERAGASESESGADVGLDGSDDGRFGEEIAPDRLIGLAWVELSTGQFQTSTVEFRELFDHLARISPSECLIQEDFRRYFPDWFLENTTLTQRPNWVFARQTAFDTLAKHFGLKTFEGFGFESVGEDVFALQAAGAALDYLLETQKQSLEHIAALTPYRISNFMEIDESTRRSLEISRTLREGRREGTLLSTIDNCSTAMGSRLLADWIACPLIDKSLVELRLDAIEELIGRETEANEVRSLFHEVSDLERLISRIVQGRATPRELVAVGATLAVFPKFKTFLETSSSSLMQTLGRKLILQTELCEKLSRAFVKNLPLNYRDGNFIASEYNAELARYRGAEDDAKRWMLNYQRQEQERTGFKNLQVSYSSVFGYYIECSRSQASKVPENYTRKQTLKNVERYTTPELKKHEEETLGAKEKALELEMELFAGLQSDVANVHGEIQKAANVLAHLDVLVGLAEIAAQRNYCRPKIVDEPILDIKDGRHPTLDASFGSGEFVPNDARCDDSKGYLHLITGPNMAGKSTYIRQTALLALMAQIGSFIPASSATIGIVDRIFARVGASDELTRGQSTFMVEMIETARILNNATRSSLVILDEIGRGTSTYDGVALAWAIAERLANTIKCRAFFATHYHELTDLADIYPGVNNLNVVVREWKDEIAFLHKIEDGAADKSYGVHVARLAGVPKDVVDRAQEILVGLEDAQVVAATEQTRAALRKLSRASAKKKEPTVQFSLFGPEDHPIISELKRLEVDSLTPMEALLTLERWKKSLKNDDNKH